MKLRKLWIPFLLVAGFSIIGSGCKKKVDLTETETPGVVANSYVKSNAKTVEETTTAPTMEETSVSTIKIKGIESISKTYQNDKINISYPELSNLKDKALGDQINKKIQNNIALALEAMKLDPSTTALDVKEEIIGANDKRISIAYTGTIILSDGSAKNIFFTNNIDAKTGKDLGLSDFVDPQTMAGYILSNDVKLYNASKELTEKFLTARHNTSYDDYLDMLMKSDFPFEMDSEGKITSFPKSFSYVKNGDVYFSVPVSAELGDYIIIVYSPESK